MSGPNTLVDLVDYQIRKVLFTEAFFDPDLGWRRAIDGSVTLHRSYGCGRPTSQWLSQSPRP